MEEEQLPYLTESEVQRAKMLIGEIEDLFNSIKVEIFTRQRPYKSYMNEKLQGVITDIKCLESLIKD